jgi:aspartyl protease family protein
MAMRRRQVASWVAGVLAVAVAAARAQGAAGVQLAGRMGERALLMIDGRAQVLAVGQAAAGTRLLRWDGETAVVEREGRLLALQIGASPSQLGAAAPQAGEREIVIPAGPGGHFVTAGAINGRAVQFIVDTGATAVALSQAEALRLGLDLKAATPVLMQTANGTVPAQRVMLASVRVGAVQVSNVDAVVLPAALPQVLLGNSFLARFQMRRDNDVMRLALR